LITFSFLILKHSVQLPGAVNCTLRVFISFYLGKVDLD